MEDFLVLVDIGNTHFHIFKNGEIIHSLKPLKLGGDIFYISVNEKREKEFLALNPKAINLVKFVKFDTPYKGLGIDRIMACKSIKSGVVIDAGSAITIDVMDDFRHLGGIIMPGLRAFREAFAKISPKLDMEFTKIDLLTLPTSTKEAISYGSIGAVVRVIESLGNKKIYLTGGDGRFLQEYVGGEFIEDLVFRGMIKTIKEEYENSFAKR
ncbi:MAG: type III pantothenate kinase [Nautiliaceae bacterium]